ncbi:MAG: glycosyltransferase family 4 protein [Elusimicrobia bacterium]|nr:glycosyltransferase family 4 protein [Elusimicrobiota bacterium]
MRRVAGRIAVLCPAPRGMSPAQRFRYEQYLGHLADAGFEVDLHPFMPEFAMRVLYRPGNLPAKAAGLLMGFLRRLLLLLRAGRYDWFFVAREASPLGPPFVEWALKASGRRIVYDFDDAIYLPNVSSANRFISPLKCFWKVAAICRWSHRVSVCNPYLVRWASAYCRDVRLIPTTVDTSYHRSSRTARPGARPLVLGWTGSHSSTRYLEVVREALYELRRQREFEFHVICDVDPGFPDLSGYRFVRWRLETEISDLDRFDIGLMPVPREDWAPGKVGFKAIQYSAMGIVPVVSSTGSGGEVVEDGVTGLVVDNEAQAWVRALRGLIDDRDSLAAMGGRARERIQARYSVDSQRENYAALFRK